MSVVGSAEVVVTAITAPAVRQIQSALSSAARGGNSSGANLGRSFMRGFNSQVNANAFTRVSRGLGTLAPNADRARASFSALARAGYVSGTALSSLVGSIGALVGGLGSFIGVAAGAIGSLAAIGSAGFAAASGIIAASLALSGVGAAYSALNRPRAGGGGGGAAPASGGGGGGGDDTAAQKAAQEARYQATRRVEDAERSLALTIERNRENLTDANNRVRDAQEALNQALAEGREEIQQLGFDAEDAALSEQKAAIELEKARETLQRVQDLPPNSRARREAELAYQTAELNYRKTKDAAADLAAEQDRLAKTGVNGTEGVIDATAELEQAELDRARTARDGLRDQADAERDLAEAKRDRAKADERIAAADAAAAAGGGGGGGGGGIDPFAGLNQAQIDFVKGLQKLRDEFEELERVAAENFLPKLLKALNIIFDRSGVVFPVLRDGIGQVADAMGDGVVSLAEAIAEPANLKDLTGAFEGSAQLIRTAGVAAGNAWGVAITLINEAFPIAQRFMEFLNTRLDTFDQWMDSVDGKNSLRDFFQRSEDAMAQFGRIFDNIFIGFGDIIDANLGQGGGQVLLTWLETATQGFADLRENMGEEAFTQYFTDAATNMKSMFQTIGAIIGEIIALGDNPAIGEMWEVLGEAAEPLGNMVEKMIEAAPVAAELVVRILEIMDAFTDTVSAEVFFGVLLDVATTVRDLFSSELAGNILAVVGPLLAMGLAFRTLTGPVKFLGNVGLGALKGFTGGIGAMIGGVAKANQAFAVMTYSSKGLQSGIGRVGFAMMRFLGPIGIILSVIGLLVTAFTAMYRHNEGFRNSVDGLVASLMPVLQNVLGGIMSVFQQLQPVLTQAFGTIMAAVQTALPPLVAAFQAMVTAIAPLIPMLINALVPAILAIVQAVIPLVTTLVSALVPAIAQIIAAIVPLIANIISALVPAFTAIVEAVVPLITLLINSLVPVFTQIVEAVVPLITLLIDALVPVFVQIIDAIVPLITTIIDALVPAIVAIVEALTPVITTIADALIPIVNALIEVLNFLIPIFIEILKVVIEVFTNIVNFIITAITTIVSGISGFITTVSSNWNNFWGAIFKFFSDTWNNITTGVDRSIKFVQNVIKGTIDAISKTWNSVWQGISDFFGDIFDNIGNVVRGVQDTFENVFGGIADFIQNVFGNIVGFVRGPINSIIDMVNGAISRLNGLSINVPDWVPGIGGQNWGFNLPSIPRLAKGGTVFPSYGGSIVNVAEAGKAERIEPLDDNGLSKRDKAMIDYLGGGPGGGTTINIYQQPGESAEDLAEQVSRIISRDMRRGAYA